jgi:hypothetical protein
MFNIRHIHQEYYFYGKAGVNDLCIAIGSKTAISKDFKIVNLEYVKVSSNLTIITDQKTVPQTVIDAILNNEVNNA